MRHDNRIRPSAGLRPMRPFAAVLLAGLLMPFTGVQARLSVESKWQDQNNEVSIDGSAEEWLKTMTYVEKAGMYIGVRNDENYLYLCLHSSNRETGARAMSLGLTVALGGKLSVQFPIGMMAPGGPPPGAPGRDRMPGPAADSLILDHSELRHPQRLPVDNEFGVQARLALETDFVYELKVPVVKTEALPYAIEAESGGKISVRVDTPKSERPEIGGRPGGPGGGMPSGHPGGGGPGGMGSRPVMPEPIHFKVKVQLATDPNGPR